MCSRPAWYVVDLGRVVDQPVCGRPSCLAVDLCDGRPVCGRPVLSMVDLCMWSTWLERRTGRGVMGVQLPVLTSEPAINSSERWLQKLLFWNREAWATVSVLQRLSVGLREPGGIHLSRREFLYHRFTSHSFMSWHEGNGIDHSFLLMGGMKSGESVPGRRREAARELSSGRRFICSGG